MHKHKFAAFARKTNPLPYVVVKKKKEKPAGKLLANGFRIGEVIEYYYQSSGIWKRGVVGHPGIDGALSVTGSNWAEDRADHVWAFFGGSEHLSYIQTTYEIRRVNDDDLDSQ